MSPTSLSTSQNFTISNPYFLKIHRLLSFFGRKFQYLGHWKKTEQRIFVADKRFQVKMDDRNVIIDFVKFGSQIDDF